MGEAATMHDVAHRAAVEHDEGSRLRLAKSTDVDQPQDVTCLQKVGTQAARLQRTDRVHGCPFGTPEVSIDLDVPDTACDSK